MKKVFYLFLLIMFCASCSGSSSTSNGGGSTFTFESSDLTAAAIPTDPFAAVLCGGSNTSPKLNWSNTPTTNVGSLAITMVDQNAYDPVDPSVNFVHWIVYNIDPSVEAISEQGISANQITGTGAGDVASFGPNSYDENPQAYGGPCPPYPPETTHTYQFKIWALSEADLSGEDMSTPASAYSVIDSLDVDSATFTKTYTSTQ